jgi:hypothetical protein
MIQTEFDEISQKSQSDFLSHKTQRSFEGNDIFSDINKQSPKLLSESYSGEDIGTNDTLTKQIYENSSHDEKFQNIRRDNIKKNKIIFTTFKKEKVAGLLNDKKKTKINCNCKNSQCLKFYCECFSTMLYCDPSVCSCKKCFNNSKNEVKIKLRN